MNVYDQLFKHHQWVHIRFVNYKTENQIWYNTWREINRHVWIRNIIQEQIVEQFGGNNHEVR